MRKPAFCICKSKGADQLRGHRAADQRLGFHHINSTIPFLSKSEVSQVSSYLLWLTDQFVSDLVPKDKFSSDTAQFMKLWYELEDLEGFRLGKKSQTSPGSNRVYMELELSLSILKQNIPP